MIGIKGRRGPVGVPVLGQAALVDVGEPAPGQIGRRYVNATRKEPALGAEGSAKGKGPLGPRGQAGAWSVSWMTFGLCSDRGNALIPDACFSFRLQP